ncbi:glycosyltransferase family 2 protein [Paracoccus sp. JM45]|uniref:glycosyltransferase n=1 Tax=Paracoccus sp. JM45 TaxID=2283626 RepID=UPI000E6CCEBE|nr:glycosyltransferase [Paracoccus sp. JM45]RJE78712.1 glycosyltransferase [Paracoccus sp. JM45]
MNVTAFQDRVLIGICTFRRAELADTLASLEGLTPCGLPVAIAIADNDGQPSARDLVEGIATRHAMPVTYLHAPQTNISIARNALLDHARATGARFLVYLDDDETVEADWLMHLVQTLEDTDAGAVLGPVRAHYQPTAPAWMDHARAHDTLPVFDKNGVITSGYTCNVLIDLADPAVEHLRFNPSRGRAGGEDSAFFADFLAAGGSISFAPKAMVHETVPDDRARLAWLLRRRYRMGQTHASLAAKDSPRKGRIRSAGVAMAKAAACGGLAIIGAARPAQRNRQLMRAALHIGAVAYLGGARQIEIYGTAQERLDTDPRSGPKEN